jgi:hypothetical protein
MTVSTTTTKDSYSGNGSTTVFAYTFKIFDDDDITVILRTTATGNETVQTKTTDYSVSGVGDANGGNITFVTAPPATETVVLLRSTAQTQLTDYTPNDPFPAEAHEDALDKLTFITQDIQEELSRSLKVSQTNSIATATFTATPTARANKVLSFDSNGDLLAAQELGTFRGTDATVTTASYDERDLVKSTTAAQLDNVYIALQASPSGTLLTNTTYWALVVDAVSAATSAAAAASSASAAAADAILTAADVVSTNADVVLTNADVVTTNQNVIDAQAAQAAAELAADNFDDTYLGAKASDPTVDNDGDPLNAGDLYFNTTSDNIKVYDGSSWANVASGSTLSAVVDDGTPQLGGNLDMNGNDIVTTSNGTIDLAPNGTGTVVVRGNTNSGAIVFNCEANTHGQTVIAQPHSAAVTNTLTLPADGDAELVSTVAAQTLTNKTLDGASSTGNLNFGDNNKAQFGAGTDLQIYHDGSHSYIDDAGTGRLYIRGNGAVELQKYTGEKILEGNADGAVNLYYDNSKKVETTATGIDVTGEMQADSLDIDGDGDISGNLTVGGTVTAKTDTDTTNTGSVTLDFGANQNFVLTLTGNVTLANPTTEQVGQSGFIVFIQDATGGRTVSLGTDYETAGGAGINLSASASTTDVVPYIVAASGRILLGTPQLAFS